MHKIPKAIPLVKWGKSTIYKDKVRFKWMIQFEEDSDINQYVLYTTKPHGGKEEFKAKAIIPRSLKNEKGEYIYDLELPDTWKKIGCFVVGITRENKATVRSEINTFLNTSFVHETITKNPFKVTVFDQKSMPTKVLISIQKDAEKISQVHVFLKSNITKSFYDMGQIKVVHGQAETDIRGMTPAIIGFGSKENYELHLHPVFENGEVSGKVFQFPFEMSGNNLKIVPTKGVDIIPIFSSVNGGRGIKIRIIREDVSILGVRILRIDKTVEGEFFRPLKQGHRDKVSSVFFDVASNSIEVVDSPVYEGHQMVYQIELISDTERECYISSPITVEMLPKDRETEVAVSKTGIGEYDLTINKRFLTTGKQYVSRGKIMKGQIIWEQYKLFDIKEDEGLKIVDGIDKSIFDAPVKIGEKYIYRVSDMPYGIVSVPVLGDKIVDTSDIAKGRAEIPSDIKYSTINKESDSPLTVLEINEDDNNTKAYIVNYTVNGKEKTEKVYGKRYILKGKDVQRISVTPVDLSNNENEDKKVIIEDLASLGKK